MMKRNSTNAPEPAAPSVLAEVVARFAGNDGDHHTVIPALTLHRRSAPTEPLHCIYNLGLGVVAQGNKQVLVGRETMPYGPGQSMLTTIDLPVVSHVTHASARQPFLGLMLTLDVRSVVQVASELDVAPARGDGASRSIAFEPLESALLDALVRLVRLLDEPTLAPRLAPLIQQEIVIRLLTGPHGPQLLRLVTSGSPSQQIAKSVAWLKQNFVETLRIDDVADRAHMSPSTFRQHFRALTGVAHGDDFSRRPVKLAHACQPPRPFGGGDRGLGPKLRLCQRAGADLAGAHRPRLAILPSDWPPMPDLLRPGLVSAW